MPSYRLRLPICGVMRRIILVRLSKRRDYRLRREPVLERHDAPFYCPREGLLGGAELLRGGDEYAVALFSCIPEQGHALDEVALGPETQDLQLGYFPGVCLSKCKVGD